MYRKALIDLLLNNPTRLYDIARPLGLQVKDLEDDLRHLGKTLKHEPYRLVIHPARCQKCGFVFATEHLHKPGKCPECKGTWISEPLFEIVPH
jgi:predicted Zn-ribbon and HTH transcriptional regulator